MRPRLVQRALAGMVAVAAVAALAACSSSSDAANASGSGDVQTVTVGTLRGQPHFYAPFLYQDHAVAGVKFKVVTLDSTPALTDAVASGTVDFAVTGITATISSVSQGRDLKIVASAADGGSGFIGGPNVTSVKDLVGKKVGYIQGSAPEVAMRLILKANGIDPSSVNLVALPPPQMSSALASGAVDAFFGTEIAVSLAQAAGAHSITDPYATPIGKVNIGLVTTGKLVKDNPGLVQKVVDTHAATTAYMKDNVDEWLPKMVSEFGGDQKVLKSALNNFWLRSDLSAEYQGQVQALAGAMVDLGLISTAPAATDLIDASFAPKA